jgi:hypothetical protein
VISLIDLLNDFLDISIFVDGVFLRLMLPHLFLGYLIFNSSNYIKSDGLNGKVLFFYLLFIGYSKVASKLSLAISALLLNPYFNFFFRRR